MSWFSFAAKAQQIKAISFNLYTDSLKKGVYNYINVDGKDSSGKYLPLTDNDLEFVSNIGRWEGNSLIIDTANKADSVVITASLKAKPLLKKTIVIYIKKKEEGAVLPSESELIDKWTKKKKKT